MLSTVFLDKDSADEVAKAQVAHQEAVGDVHQSIPLPRVQTCTEIMYTSGNCR